MSSVNAVKPKQTHDLTQGEYATVGRAELRTPRALGIHLFQGPP